MALIYSLIFATILSLLFTSSIKKHSWFYYILSALLSLSTTIYEINMSSNIKIEGIILDIEKASVKGIIGVSFLILVMFAGALNTKWSITKKFLRIRGELAIISSILFITHGIVYLVNFITFYLNQLSSSDALPKLYLSLVIVGIIAFILMFPLFITSFKKIRSKMKASDWKKLQRWAYLFYFLVYLHVLLIIIADRNIDWFKLSLYTIIFASYTVLRLVKYNNDKQNRISTKQA